MSIKKKSPMEHRGIRFTNNQWSKVVKEARKDKSGKTKPSDIVRGCVDAFFSN
mgnify:CR=1 FL=1